LVAADLVDLNDIGMPHPGCELGLKPKPELLGGRSELAGQHHLQRGQPVEVAVPRFVHDPHASPADLGQDLVVPNLTGGRQNHRCGSYIYATIGSPYRMSPAQRAHRRAEQVRADEDLLRSRRVLLEPLDQWVDDSQPVDAIATLGTIAEVGGDTGQVRITEPAQGQRKQFLVGRVGGWKLGHGNPSRSTTERAMPAGIERQPMANLTRSPRASETKAESTA